MEKLLTCINCPLGCQITVKLEDGVVTSVSGNNCMRGDKYVREEVVHPVRVVCSTVKVKDGDLSVVSVKTQQPIPKEKIFDVMKQINSTEIKAPVNIGDILINNVCSTGVDVVATRKVLKKSIS